MRKMNFMLVCFAAMLLVLSACAAQQEIAMFDAVDLNPKVAAGGYEKRFDNFLVILDASSSMTESFAGKDKIDIARDTVDHMIQTLPELNMTSGLRIFGMTLNPISAKTTLVYGMKAHDGSGYAQALSGVNWAGGSSPMDRAAEAVMSDFKDLTGKSAVIFVSDAKQMKDEPIVAAKKLKDHFGDRICVFTLLIGNDPNGKLLMEKMADVGGCGFAEQASNLTGSQDMADFVTKVFLSRVAPPKDSDGDGVIDDDDKCPETPSGIPVDETGCPLDDDKDGVFNHLDKCPNTPTGVSVDADGCPLDTDKDGVLDYLDKCPGTPMNTKVDGYGCPLPMDSDGDGVLDSDDRCPDTPAGAKVDQFGCWVLSGVLFDTNKSSIKPAMAAELDDAAEVLNQNPSVKVEIQGHTDNVGNAVYNLSLSEKRARSVMNYLLKKGIASERVRAKGLGMTRPVTNNGTPEGRATNRRVELKPVP